jgi:hypothetical protein
MQHQKDAISKLANGKILWGGVGTGKTITVLAYYLEKEAPKNIYVITTAKKRDSLEWEGDAAKLRIFTKREFTSEDRGVICVDSWNNIDKYIEIEDAFFIFDEQRLVGSGAWVKAFQKIAKNNNWVLLSATPGDTWMDYVPIFIANGFFKNATEFKREHVVYAPYTRYPKIVRYTGTATLEKYRNIVLVEMPYLKHTERNIEDVILPYDVETFKAATVARWHPYEERPINDVAELFQVMRKIVNSDPSRLEATKELLKKHARLIVFYNFNYELEILRTLASEVTVAEWNGHRKQPVPDTDSWVYLVQYVSGAEAWNCIETDAMVFYSMTYSYKNFEQAQGRIDRLNTPYQQLYYYVYSSNSAIDLAVRKSLSKKQLFNERNATFEEFGIDLHFGREVEDLGAFDEVYKRSLSEVAQI